MKIPPSNFLAQALFSRGISAAQARQMSDDAWRQFAQDYEQEEPSRAIQQDALVVLDQIEEFVAGMHRDLLREFGPLLSVIEVREIIQGHLKRTVESADWYSTDHFRDAMLRALDEYQANDN
jgi:hypothetical protein